jgi:uncharacterized protein YggT (Ycf19 family)
MSEYISEQRGYHPGILVTRIINGLVGIIECLLVIRLVLEILGASQSSQFVAWIYGVTSGLVAPFTGAFPAFSISGTAIDLSIVLAMIGYAIIGWLVIRLLSFIFVSAGSI